MPGVELNEGDVAIRAYIEIMGEDKTYNATPHFIIKDGMVGRVPDEISELGISVSLINIHPEDNNFTIGVKTRQKDWVVMKAIEKPLINLLWVGCIIMMIGFGVAAYRRYSENTRINA